MCSECQRLGQVCVQCAAKQNLMLSGNNVCAECQKLGQSNICAQCANKQNLMLSGNTVCLNCQKLGQGNISAQNTALGKNNLNSNIQNSQKLGNTSNLYYSQNATQTSKNNSNLIVQTSQENNNLVVHNSQQNSNLGGHFSKQSYSVCPDCQMNMNSNLFSSQQYKYITGQNLVDLNNSLCQGCGRMTVEHF